MPLFSPDDRPTAHEIVLDKDYKFMYENFIISSQRQLYLLLEESNGVIDTLCFDFRVFKYGYPNDEVGHPYCNNLYTLCRIENSPWITETIRNNRSHQRHLDSHYDDVKHYVLRFKDVTLEVLAKKYAVVKMTKEELKTIVDKELSYLEV